MPVARGRDRIVVEPAAAAASPSQSRTESESVVAFDRATIRLVQQRQAGKRLRDIGARAARREVGPEENVRLDTSVTCSGDAAPSPMSASSGRTRVARRRFSPGASTAGAQRQGSSPRDARTPDRNDRRSRLAMALANTTSGGGCHDGPAASAARGPWCVGRCRCTDTTFRGFDEANDGRRPGACAPRATARERERSAGDRTAALIWHRPWTCGEACPLHQSAHRPRRRRSTPSSNSWSTGSIATRTDRSRPTSLERSSPRS